MISADIIAYSRASNGHYIITWAVEYPRFIHSEFMTHRLFSRNAASSRAIPVQKMIDMVRESPASPIHWGKNQPGMSAREELVAPQLNEVQGMWEDAAMEAAYIAEKMDRCGAHKQIANRILEPFQTMKTVMTATCMDNFFWLRNHEDAQPEIKELARLMWEALQLATPQDLKPGEWHVPYVNTGWVDGEYVYYLYGDESKGEPYQIFITKEEALQVSSSCCAQVSYRRLDDSLEKAQMVYKRLVESTPVHASPFEHQATPMKRNADFRNKGITHMTRDRQFWSGNFIGWIQHRQLIPDNACWSYKENK